MNCTQCNKRPIKVKSKQFCWTCYMKWYYHSHPKYKQKVIGYTTNRRKKIPNLRKLEYQKLMQNPEYRQKELIRKKMYKWKIHFGGNKLLVLQRDNFQCIHCHKPTTTVHHKDGHGYTNSKQWNNDPSNLITCCQSCHMKKYHRESFKYLKNYKLETSSVS